MTLNPKFLTVEQVIALHNLQIDLFGGSHGVKDEGLLLSALGQPESGFGGEYLHKGLYEMAATYLFHLVKIAESRTFRDTSPHVCETPKHCENAITGFACPRVRSTIDIAPGRK